MLFSIRTTNYQNNLMLNICDEELVGRVLRKDDFHMNISKSYFGQRIVERNEAEELMKKYLHTEHGRKGNHRHVN